MDIDSSSTSPNPVFVSPFIVTLAIFASLKLVVRPLGASARTCEDVRDNRGRLTRWPVIQAPC